jgi:hemoglobin/transferrin/lactoferrin receptor protein
MKGNTPVYGDWYYGPEKMLLTSYQYSDTRVRKYSDQISLTLAYQKIGESRNTRSFGSNNLTQRKEELHMLSMNLDFRKKIGIHEWRYGAEMVWNEVNSSAQKQDPKGNYLGPASTRYPNGGSHMNWAGVYVSFSHELHKKWIIHEGLRLNGTLLQAEFTDKRFYEFLPNDITQKNLSLCGNIGLVYLPNLSTKFYANVGNAFRTPNVDDVGKIFDSKSGQAMIIPNAQLKAEQTITGEIGLLSKPWKNLEVDVNFYYTALFNALVVVPTQKNGADSLVYDGKLTPVFTLDNAQNAFIYGSTAAIKWKLNNNLRLSSGLSYTYGRILGDSMMPLDHIPPMYGKTEIIFQKEKWEVCAYSLYNGSKALKDYYLNGEDNLQYATANGMPAWYTLNVSGSYKIVVLKMNLNIRLGLDNILDRNYRTFASGMSAGGRNFWLNLRINF